MRLTVKHTNRVRFTNRNRLILAGSTFAFAALIAASVFMYGNLGNSRQAIAAGNSNLGFENGMLGWTQVSGTWNENTNAAHVRSGGRSSVVEVFTTEVELKNDQTIVASANKMVITAWAKASNVNGQIRLGVINTATNAKTMASSYTTLTTGGFTKITATLNVSNGVTYIPVIQAKRSTATASFVYVDDVHLYTVSGNADIINPNNASAATASVNGNTVTLGWTSGTDDGAGIDGVTVLRCTGVSGSEFQLNSQADYDATNPSAGVTAVNGFSVVYSGPATVSLSDNPNVPGAFTYLIYMRDKALNYSSAPARIVVVNDGSNVAQLNASIALDGLLVTTGSTLNLNSGTLTVRSGASLQIHGALVQNGATVTNSAGGSIVFNNGSTYRHAINGGAVLSATWQTGATCEITGVTTTLPSNLVQNFSHFTWNCASQSSAQTLPIGFKVLGNASFINSGASATGRIVNVTGTVYLGGNLYYAAGADLRFNNGSNVVFNGSVAQTIECNGVALTFSTLTVNGAGSVSLLNDVTVSTGCNLTSGTLDLSGYNLKLANGSTITRSGGSVSNGTIAVVSGNYNVTYTASLTTGLEIPTNPSLLGTLTVSGSSITAVLDKHAYVNTGLTLSGGKLNT
ncbi:MAG TPA: hypothetical protein VEY71_04670, partial [Chitinophagales bacterium]|nr:hypothetical protein [Chitinophagales bacterium]